MSVTFSSYDALIKNLIIQVRKNDQEAFEEMLQIYEPLINSFVGRFANCDVTEQDKEDFRQELTIAFHHYILSYDLSQKDVSFGLYAKSCMNNFLITQLRALKKRRSEELLLLEEDSQLLEDVASDEDPSKAIIQREELRELNKKIENALSDFENKVWRQYVSGCSTREIASALGKPEKSIENAIFRIRQKLKELFS